MVLTELLFKKKKKKKESVCTYSIMQFWFIGSIMSRQLSILTDSILYLCLFAVYQHKTTENYWAWFFFSNFWQFFILFWYNHYILRLSRMGKMLKLYLYPILELLPNESDASLSLSLQQRALFNYAPRIWMETKTKNAIRSSFSKCRLMVVFNSCPWRNMHASLIKKNNIRDLKADFQF